MRNTKTNSYNLVDTDSKTLFCKQSRSGIFGVFVVVIAIILGLEKGNLTTHNITWAVLIMSASLFRLYHAYKLYPTAESSEHQVKVWLYQLHIYSAFVGLLWVFLPLLNIEIMQKISGFYTITLLGIMAGGVYSLNRYLLTFLLYTMPAMLFLVIYHFNHNGLDGQILSGLIIAFSIAVLSYAKNTHDIYDKSFKLRNDNLNLIKKLQNQTAGLKTQKNKAELANTEKSKFLAAASHDLRQPLHAMGFYLSALESHIDSEKGLEIRKKSEKNLNSLNDLLNALIGISQLDAGDVDISPEHFNLKEACTPLIEEMSIISEPKNINIYLENVDDLVVFCDEVLLLRSMRNIIINAIKHAECSEITVSAKTLENSPDYLNISIRDNGKGIPNSQLDAIFEEFHQLDNSSKDRRIGLGLGLAIVKRIANLQDHKIAVTSSPTGSDFSIAVHLGNADFSVPTRHNKTQSSDITVANNILVIDDEIDVLDSVALLLTQWQQNVVCVTSSKNAQQEIKAGFSPNIIISDYNLYKESGITTINKIADDLTTNAQVVFVTGNVSRDKVREIRATQHPVLPKPLKPQMLKNLIKQLNKQPELGRIKQTK